MGEEWVDDRVERRNPHKIISRKTDVMSPEFQQRLKMFRRGALSILQGLRDGVIDNEEAARSLIGIYDGFVVWEIEPCGYGIAHPWHSFASRILRAAKLLMGEEWVDDYLF